MFRLYVNDQIHLELLDEHHCEELFQLITDNQEFLLPWIPWISKNKTILDTLYFIRNHKNRWVSNKGFDCGIFQDNKLCGIIGFDNIDHINKTTSIGYWIGEHYQGNGIVTSCTKKMIDITTEYYKTETIIICCAIHNTKSKNIALRIGFEVDKIIPQAEYVNREYIDHQQFILTKKEHH